MSRMQQWIRGGLLFGASAAILAACNSDTTVIAPTPVNAIFNSYVALGNSITAGYQSGGINDSTQRQSYAVLIAQQMGTRFAYPSLVAPGCPPPIANFQTQARVGGASSTSTSCAFRPNVPVATLNNVAVPGILAADPTAVGGTKGNQGNPLIDLILGGETMVQKALDAHPTFATVWVGNNDVLAAAISGLPGTATPQASFVQSYAAMINQLVAGAPGIKGVLIGVAQVSVVPVLFTGRALNNIAFLNALSAAAHKSIGFDPATCTATTNTLIGFPIISAIASGQHPPFIECEKTPTPPLGDVYILDAAEQVQVAGIVNGYNAYIKAKADSIGFAYYDPNTTFGKIESSDPILASRVPNLASATATFGQYFTLDGIHPSAAAHKLLANDLITVINAKYGTSLAPVP